MEQEKKELMNEESFVEGIAAKFKLRKIKKGLIFAAIVVAVVLAVGVYISVQRHELNSKNEAIIEQEQRIAELEELLREPAVVANVAPTIALEMVDEKVRELGELATVEYSYTNAGKFEDEGEKWYQTKKFFVATWNGVIKAGIDVHEIQTEVDDVTKTLKIDIPDAKILSHDIDEESVEIVHEESTSLNPLTVADKVEFDKKTAEAMEKSAIKSGLLEKARENAENVLLKLLVTEPAIKEHYKIVFEDIPVEEQEK